MQQLHELVDGFTRLGVGPVAVLDVGPSVASAELPSPVATTVHRVVQESLTNVRRHAPNATAVHVSVHCAQGCVRVCVRDDGHPSGQSSGARGGFGLIGLAERLDSLGGTLRAGPRPEGGWEVVATLPVAGMAA